MNLAVATLVSCIAGSCGDADTMPTMEVGEQSSRRVQLEFHPAGTSVAFVRAGLPDVPDDELIVDYQVHSEGMSSLEIVDGYSFSLSPRGNDPHDETLLITLEASATRPPLVFYWVWVESARAEPERGGFSTIVCEGCVTLDF